MLPANITKDISNNIHNSLGDSDPQPPIKPLLIVLSIVVLLYLMVKYL